MLKLVQPVTGQGIGPLGIKKGNSVYHALKRSILLRQLSPGDSLGEQHIARDLGCSQGTVREALLRLQEDGLVARRGYRGTVVSDTSPAEAAQMARIRIDIEKVGISRAAQDFGKAALESLAGLVEQIEEAKRAGDQYLSSELDRQFHLTIFQASGLSALEPILMRCALHMHRYTFGNAAKKQRKVPAAAQHEAMLRALEDGDAAAAARAVEEHIQTVIDLWSPTLRRAIEEGSRE